MPAENPGSFNDFTERNDWFSEEAALDAYTKDLTEYRDSIVKPDDAIVTAESLRLQHRIAESPKEGQA